MAQFARPDSNVTTTNMTNGFSAIDESTPSDADFAFSANNTTAELEVGLSNVTDPTLSSGHIFRYRYAKTNAGTPDSGGSNCTLTVRLLQGATQIATSSSISVSSATWTSAQITLSAAEANAITDYTDLRLEFAIDGGGGSPSNRRGVGISWAELEVPSAPTTVPASFTANTIVKRNLDTTFTANAVIKRTQLNSPRVVAFPATYDATLTSTNADWNAAQAGSSVVVEHESTTDVILTSSLESGNYIIRNTYHEFDTSAIATHATIVDSYLEATSTSSFTAALDFLQLQDWTSPVTAADWREPRLFQFVNQHYQSPGNTLFSPGIPTRLNKFIPQHQPIVPGMTRLVGMINRSWTDTPPSGLTNTFSLAAVEHATFEPLTLTVAWQTPIAVDAWLSAPRFTADAVIVFVSLIDTFTRDVPDGMGTSDNGITYQRLRIDFDQGLMSGGLVDGDSGMFTVEDGTTEDAFIGYPAIRRGLIQYDIYMPQGNIFIASDWSGWIISSAVNSSHVFPNDILEIANEEAGIATAGTEIVSPFWEWETTYRFKSWWGQSGESVWIKWWKVGDTEPIEPQLIGTHDGATIPITPRIHIQTASAAPASLLAIDNLSILSADTEWEMYGQLLASAELNRGGRFTADAVLFGDLAFVADAVIEIIRTASLTADAVVRSTTSATFTADAIVRTTQTASLAADAIVGAASSASFTANAVIRTTIAASLTADAIIRAITTASFSTDAVIRATIAASFTADAVTKATQAASFTADAVKVVRTTGSFTADAVVFATIENSLVANAVQKATLSATLTADAILLQVWTASLTADAVVRAVQAGGFTANAVELKTIEATFTADAVILASRTVGFSADAVLSSTHSASLTADAVIRATLQASFLTDAIVLAEATATLTADAIIRATVVGGWAADAAIQRTQLASATADAAIQRRTEATLTADAVLKSTRSASFTGDAFLAAPGANVGSFTSDAVVKATGAFSITADGIKRSTTVNAFTCDAMLRVRQESAIVSDGVLKATQAASLAMDSVLRRVTNSAFVADGVVRTTSSASFSAEACLRRTQSNSLVGNGVIRATIVASRTADAIVRTTTSAGYSIDAYIIVVSSAAITADSWIQPAFTSDAVIVGIFPARRLAVSITADIHGMTLDADQFATSLSAETFGTVLDA